MSGINKAMLIGHLGADPEVRTLNSGTRVASFSLATSESWKDKATGERKERTEWHRIVVFAPGLVDLAEKYLKKGSKAYVEGQIATRKWQDSAGQDRYSTEIVLQPFRGEIQLLDRREGSGRPDPDPDAYGTTRMRDEAPAPADLNDEIPF